MTNDQTMRVTAPWLIESFMTPCEIIWYHLTVHASHDRNQQCVSIPTCPVRIVTTVAAAAAGCTTAGCALYCLYPWPTWIRRSLVTSRCYLIALDRDSEWTLGYRYNGLLILNHWTLPSTKQFGIYQYRVYKHGILIWCKARHWLRNGAFVVDCWSSIGTAEHHGAGGVTCGNRLPLSTPKDIYRKLQRISELSIRVNRVWPLWSNEARSSGVTLVVTLSRWLTAIPGDEHLHDVIVIVHSPVSNFSWSTMVTARTAWVSGSPYCRLKRYLFIQQSTT